MFWKCHVINRIVPTICHPNWLARALGVTMLTVAVAAPAQWSGDCGSLEHINGPFDYRNPADPERLNVVEFHHFTPEVERLLGHNKCGNNRCKLGGDLNYTLMAFPNHHRALMSMSRYHLEGLHNTERAMKYSADCYFDRAIRWVPDDATVRMIFGNHLYKSGDLAKSLEQFEIAAELAPDSAEAQYNVGLMYAKQGNYAAARKHAHRAYELGYPLSGLRKKLMRAGQWEVPESTTQASTE